MKKLLKKLLLLYLCFVISFIAMGQIFVDNGILTKAQISCQNNECVVTEKYLLTDKTFQQFSFNQNDVKDMWLQEDLRGYNKLWSSFDKITQCLNCGDWNLIHFPFNWWRKSSAETFINILSTEPEVQYQQYHRSLSWLGIILSIATFVVMGLYKSGKIK